MATTRSRKAWRGTPEDTSRGFDSVMPYLLLAPGMLATVIFVVVPLLLVFGLAFFNLNLVTGTSDFVGVQNFAVEFVHPEFARSISNTLLYALYTIIPSMVLGLLVALLIHGLTGGQGFWRSVYFLPVATTLVAMSAVWRWMFRADTGIVDTVLAPLLGIRDWLGDPQLALHAIAVVGNWHQVGMVTVLYLAALGSLPRDPDESAQVDGAGPWARFWHVTWPALGPTTVFAFITTASSALQAYDTIAAMTQGDPLGSTETLTYMIWVRGIHYFDIGRAAVLSIALLLLSVLATLAQRTGYGRRLEQGGAR